MGEDLHQRIYVKSKKTGSYVNAHEICEWNPEYSMFKEMVGGRNYDVFSLFGSHRGNYSELPYSNYGMPDFLRDTMFDDYCRESGFYGFVWFKLPDLKKALDEYRKRLQSPLKYLDPDSDEYADWRDVYERKSPDEIIGKYLEWITEHRHMLDRLDEMWKTLDEYDQRYFNTYAKLIDIDETVFMFFFDC